MKQEHNVTEFIASPFMIKNDAQNVAQEMLKRKY